MVTQCVIYFRNGIVFSLDRGIQEKFKYMAEASINASAHLNTTPEEFTDVEPVQDVADTQPRSDACRRWHPTSR